MTEVRTVHTYKELLAVAGYWTTVEIKNDYITGSDHFTLTYHGKSVMYQNDDIQNVASISSLYNGISNRELQQFNAIDYVKAN